VAAAAASATAAELFAPATRLNVSVERLNVPVLRRRSIHAIVTACLLAAFVWIGYWLSDDRFFAQLIARERIASPADAFRFVRDHTSYPREGVPLVMRRTPRRMLTLQKFLFCDQSAIVLATIVNKLGYETALIDLHGPDGESHHTVLDVREKGSWTVYDVAYNLQGHPLDDSARYYDSGRRFTPRAVYRPYPLAHQWLMQHNVFVQRFALWLKTQ